MLEQVGFIVLAVVFLTHGGMMFVLLHTIYKQLPHAQFIAVLYVLVCHTSLKRRLMEKASWEQPSLNGPFPFVRKSCNRDRLLRA